MLISPQEHLLELKYRLLLKLPNSEQLRRALPHIPFKLWTLIAHLFSMVQFSSRFYITY